MPHGCVGGEVLKFVFWSASLARGNGIIESGGVWEGFEMLPVTQRKAVNVVGSTTGFFFPSPWDF